MDWAARVLKYSSIFIFLIQASVAYAQVFRFQSETSSSTRSLGMGDAGINSERGPYSVFYNPANIAAKDTKTHIEIINIQAEANEALYKMGTKSASIYNLGGLYNDLKTNKGEFAGGRFAVYPNATFRNFSIGMLYEVNRGAMIDPRDDGLFVRARDRFAPVGALSFRLWGGVLRFGASIAYLTVGEADTKQSIPIDEGNLSYAKYIHAGAGFSKNAGMTLTLPFRYLPSFSVVARDILGTNYTLPPLVKFGGLKSPTRRPMTFDFGASFLVLITPRIDIKFEADYRDYVNKYQGTLSRHLYYGTEISAYDFLHLRAGMMNGYYTGGVGFGSRKFSFDLAVYSNELEDRFRTSKETRFAFQMSWGLFQ